MLKGKKTELINDPQRARSMYRVTLSGLRDVRPLEIDDLEMNFNALDIAKKLVSGIDSAYAIFLDDSSPPQHTGWFSPAQCSSGKRCKKCKKELFPCERCEAELEMVGERIRCMCNKNSESIREAIRWIRLCTEYCDDTTFPKHLEDGHFLLSDACLFSSVCREINKVLAANRREPVRHDGAIWYAAGTYTEDEIRPIMRPLREEIEKHQQTNKPRGKRQLTELRGLGKEIWGGMDAQAYVNQMRDEWQRRLTLLKEPRSVPIWIRLRPIYYAVHSCHSERRPNVDASSGTRMDKRTTAPCICDKR